MEQAEFRQMTCQIIARVLDINEAELLDADQSLIDSHSGLDSISMINIIVELEEAFDISFSDEDLIESTFQSINTLIGVISKHLEEDRS